MILPPPEVCQHILALHVLLGSSSPKRDEHRQELLELLAAHNVRWTDLPEIFSLHNIQSAQPLPIVDSKEWKRCCRKICQLHGMLGSADKDGSVAQEKLTKELVKWKFNWSNDLPAILAADWLFNNPQPSSSTGATSSSDDPAFKDVQTLTKIVIGDRIVMEPAKLVIGDRVVIDSAELIVTTLIVLCSHVYHQFSRIPQLGAVAPSSGHGKTTLMMEVVGRLVRNPWYSSHTTAAAFYRRLHKSPITTVILDQREHQNWGSDIWTLIDIAFEGGNKDLVIDGELVSINLLAPVFWAIRGEIRDVPGSILSRGFQVVLEKKKPKIRISGKKVDLDHDYIDDLGTTREEICKWAPTCSLDFNPKLPPELDNDRLADICRPLISIADSLGHGEEARAALIKLCAARPPQDMGVQALIDARIAFKELGIKEGEVDYIRKEDLAKAVVKFGDPYWSHWRGPKDQKNPHELTPIEFGQLLARFGIYAKTIWPPGDRAEVKSIYGYQIDQFKDAWAKYCAEPPQPAKLTLVKS